MSFQEAQLQTLSNWIGLTDQLPMFGLYKNKTQPNTQSPGLIVFPFCTPKIRESKSFFFYENDVFYREIYEILMEYSPLDFKYYVAKFSFCSHENHT